ncbi:protein Lines homolog 1 [Lepisosteus oculatus]|uniref:Lines homolog 1 n=1 Tax=Lepisosteus oculatus TaxID=7918 RepID=W5N4X3_LEPOC|nr:PREDICTED: protein Lines homolog 1 [Lepisosteus oculatus]XP_015198442.1 PREDICTED: protein Lines homolog 1 [Lepisosteus oculatus]XP_015198443.1 PREDICTED: protein Lines homolog 1 [Lepisosteus oculatus]
MDHSFLVLQDIYRRLLAGVTLDKGDFDVASVIYKGISDHWPEASVNSLSIQHSNKSAQHMSFACPVTSMNENNHCEKQMEMMCFVLSLIEIMSSKVQSCISREHSSLYDILRILLEEKDLMSKLVSLFGIQDKLLSHLAVKCASSLVLFQIGSTNSFDLHWQQMCLQTLLKRCPDNEMNGCLWSLTFVIKGLLRGVFQQKMEILGKLLTSLDLVFPALHSMMFSFADFSQELSTSSKYEFGFETSLASFIDLIEVLIAARTKLKTLASSQRLLFIQASLALQLVGSPVHCSVKKKMLLLLKRCLLQKAGEDFSIGQVKGSLLRDDILDSDMLMLATAVLQSPFSGWLQSVSVSSNPSYFGGTSIVGENVLGSADCVMLRAAILTLIKSLEYKVLHAGSVPGFEIQGYLPSLMLFLKKHLNATEQQLCHPCSWVSVVFLDQDDDMMEAAKAMLTLYLHFRRVSNTEVCDAELFVQLTHEYGCNPHCHFLFFLNSVAFDHTVLLDFLISTETCFLEYFVGYLKILRENWQDFCYICQHFEKYSSQHAVNKFTSGEHSAASLYSGSIEPVWKMMSSVDPALSSEKNDAKWNDSKCSVSGIITSSLGPLVDYASSEESEPEELNISYSSTSKETNFEEFKSTCIKGKKLSSSNLYEVTKDPRTYLSSSLGSQEKLQKEHQALPTIFKKTVVSLIRLRKVISRLERRHLFPYKPKFLLKLLMHIEANSGCSE